MNNRRVELTGIIIFISDLIQPTETFQKKTILLQFDNNGYKETYPFEFEQMRSTFPDHFAVGEKVKITGFLKGNFYQKEGENPTAFLQISATDIKKME